jgi:hypothetical protein
MFTRDQIATTLKKLYPTLAPDALERLADGHMEQQALQQAAPPQQELLHPTYRAMGPQTCDADVPLTQDAYRASGGGQCPQCQGVDIGVERFNPDGGGLVSQRCACPDCGLRWADMYRLAAYVREGEAEDKDWEAFAATEIIVRQPGPAPQPLLYVVTYGHKYGTDVAVYSTEEKAREAMADIKAAYPDEFDEDDPRSWLDLTESTLDV